MIKYLFRHPIFPVICDVDGHLFGARSHADFEDQVEAVDLRPGQSYPMVDASGEGWVLVSDYMVVSPVIAKKRWLKREIIGWFNGSKIAAESGIRYSERSLSSKRLDRIVREIVELLSTAHEALNQSKHVR